MISWFNWRRKSKLSQQCYWRAWSTQRPSAVHGCVRCPNYVNSPPLRLFLAIILGVLLAGCGSVTVSFGPSDPTAAPASASVARVPAVTDTPAFGQDTATHNRAAQATATARSDTASRPATLDGFKVVSSKDLPQEARDTLDLIRQGGPFLYRQDGIVFQNREGYLPRKASGYYHEYTVVTPGSPDRGARRIITGASGEIYYTADHYNTFVRVLEP